MTTLEQQSALPVTAPRNPRKGSLMADWLSSTDHKVIGHLYLITSFGFFLAGGLMAMIMRLQLFEPENHIVSDQQYNELFTMHGTIMLLLFATPLFVGFANEIMPLQIGSPDFQSERSCRGAVLPPSKRTAMVPFARLTSSLISRSPSQTARWLSRVTLLPPSWPETRRLRSPST